MAGTTRNLSLMLLPQSWEGTQLVANLLLLEAEAEGYRYRLAGSEVVRQAGLDMTGRRVGYSGKYNGIMTEWLAMLDFVRRHQTPRLVVSHFAPDVTAKNIVLALPLHTPDGTAAKLLVGSFCRGHFESGLKVEGLSVMEEPLVPD